MLPKKIPVKDAHFVKIAVELEHHNPQLINFDKRLPLTDIIQDICIKVGITDPENYALQFSDKQTPKYVTENNRNEIINGTVLKLPFSPTKTANDSLETLRTGTLFEKKKCLTELSKLSTDPIFATEFISEQSLKLLIDIIEDINQNDQDILRYALASFVELMDHGTVSWDMLQTNFIQRNIYIVCHFADFSKECVESALSNLENVVAKSNKHLLVEKDVTLKHLLDVLQESKSSVAQQNVIALINALFLKGDDNRKRQIAQTINSKQYRSAHIGSGSLGTEMTHQLFVLQTLILGLLEHRMRQKVTHTDREAQDKIKELRSIAFDDFTSIPIGGYKNDELRRMASGGSCAYNTNINFAQFYKKLGFKNDTNPIQDFDETPPGVLALDCMLYFARSYPQQYTKIIHENSSRINEQECPFVTTSIELVKLLCDILHIGESPADQTVDFQPMFFTHDHPFEEFFCICVITLNRTWKDMRATAEDFAKVFSVVREQIIRTLKKHPENLDDFRAKIALLPYHTITHLRQQERNSKEECDSTAFAIVKLKEKISPFILELIKQQRLSFLVEGSRFSKYTRGVRSKDKFWYARLSPNHKTIHYGDCDEKTIPTLEEMSNKIIVADIKQLLEGKDCPQKKDNRKVSINLAFSIAFDSMDQPTLDFVAPDATIFNYWTDGIHALLGQEMVSKQKKEDFDTLLSIEIKLRLLDTEGVDISKDPPPTPDDPEDYDFCYEN